MQEDDDVESNAPSSPRSTYADEQDDELERQPAASQPRLCSTSPAASYPALSTTAAIEVRITDNSHSHSNPSQRKKGGCKSVQLTVRLPSTGASYVVAAKCDVRKSFSNRSFSKYYNRGPYAVVPVNPEADVVLIVEEAKRGRDGKHFVAMEQGCVAPWAANDKRRHPLLAFAADAVYKVSVMTKPGMGEAEVEVKCQFAQGSATVSMRPTPAASESRKRAREVQVKHEVEKKETDEDEDEDDSLNEEADKRQKLDAEPDAELKLERCYSPDSTDSTASTPSSPDSAFSTISDSIASSPYPHSPYSSTASPSPPASPLLNPFSFTVDHVSSYLLDQDDSFELLKTAGTAASTAAFVASPLLVPVWPQYPRLSPAGFEYSPRRSAPGLWMPVMDDWQL